MSLEIRAVSTLLAPGSVPHLEDYLLVNPERKILVLADGFGGPPVGAIAAKTACEGVRDFLEKEAGDLEATLPFVLRSYFSLAGNVLFNSLIHANRRVTSLNRGKNVNEKGGASVITAYQDGPLLAIANAGACSAWLYRQGKSRELVSPRSRARLLNPFQEISGLSNAPLMALGLADDLEPEISEFAMEPEDWVLFHTDGIGVRQRELVAQAHRAVLRGEQAVPEASQRLTELLRTQAYADNAGAVVVMF